MQDAAPCSRRKTTCFETGHCRFPPWRPKPWIQLHGAFPSEHSWRFGLVLAPSHLLSPDAGSRAARRRRGSRDLGQTSTSARRGQWAGSAAATAHACGAWVRSVVLSPSLKVPHRCLPALLCLSGEHPLSALPGDYATRRGTRPWTRDLRKPYPARRAADVPAREVNSGALRCAAQAAVRRRSPPWPLRANLRCVCGGLPHSCPHPLPAEQQSCLI